MNTKNDILSTNSFWTGIKYLLCVETDFTRKLIWELQNIILSLVQEKKTLYGSDEKSWRFDMTADFFCVSIRKMT